MDHDVLILGCGPAGYYAALGCARAGLRTVIVEKEALGGTGFRWGCLPVKMMLDMLRALRQGGRTTALSRRFGRGLLEKTQAAMRGVEQRLTQDLARSGVRLVSGEGAFTGPHTVSAGGASLSARTIVIATGTRPAALPGLVMDGKTVASHVELVGGKDIPATAAIIGADVEGIELACLLAHLGARIELIEKESEILPGMDRDLAAPIGESLFALGTRFRLNAEVTGVRADRKGATVLLRCGPDVRAARVVATGMRSPNFPDGLELAGVARAADRVTVDERFRTSAPHVYAIGDINGLCGMAHAAIQQGLLLPEIVRGGNPGPSVWPSLPRAIFTIPEIAGAGLQARELEGRGIPFERATFALADTWRGISKGVSEGFVTVLAGKDRRLLGIWACGDSASELAAPFGFLLDREATVDELLRSLFIHPTLAEGLREAAWRLGEKIRGNTAAQ